MKDPRVVVHLQPDEVLVERGRTEGLIPCRTCGAPTVHYVTCPGDDDDNHKLWANDDEKSWFAWRCTNCEDAVDLTPEQTVAVIYAKQALIDSPTGHPVASNGPSTCVSPGKWAVSLVCRFCTPPIA